MAESLIDWPSSLPQQPLLDGYSEKAPGKKIRTEMDAATAKQRNRFSTTAIAFTSTFLMTNAQYATFKTFFTNTLNNGTLEFNQYIPGNTVTKQVVRFTEENYTPQFLGLHVRVSCSLEVMP